MSGARQTSSGDALIWTAAIKKSEIVGPSWIARYRGFGGPWRARTSDQPVMSRPL